MEKNGELLIDRIINNLIMHTSISSDVGLYHGKMGIIIFFMHYARLTGEMQYNNYAEDLLDDLINEISITLPINFEDGLSGIGWGIEYLLENKFISGDSNEILDELDNRIMQFDIRRIEDKSIKKGIKGLSFYIAKRISSSKANKTSMPFDRLFLSEWQSLCNYPIPSDNDILMDIMHPLPIGDNIFEWKLGLENGAAGWGLWNILHKESF